jgi:hypothetical protein
MKKMLYKLLLAINLFFAAGTVSQASHNQGGEITYQCVAPGVYVVNVMIYRDCTGAAAEPSITLNINSPGCNAGRTFTVQRTGNSTIGDPYCASIPKTCSTVRANYEEVIYTATVTFTAAEMSCSTWLFSTTNSARPEIANLVNPQGNIYIEASLLLSAGNNSATINPTAPKVEFVCYQKETRINLNAYDPDCDSLSYELVASLSAAGVPYTYKPTQLNSITIFVNPNPLAPYCNTCTPNNPQIGMYQNVPANYSPTFPFLSMNGDWNAINPATGIPYQTVPYTPYFNFDAASGELRFRPDKYTVSPPYAGLNKYVVVVKITEWRKIGGVAVKVGHIRRDILFMVEDCGANLNPEVTNIIANGQLIQPGSIVTVRPGAPLNIQFSTSDQPGDNLTLDTDAATALPGATFNQSSAVFPTGTISWIAPATNGTCGVRYFYMRVRDNACPIRGKRVYVVGVRVSNTGTATGLKEDRTFSRNFIAYPNPFTESVSFRLDGEQVSGKHEIEIYNGLGQQIDRFAVPAGKQEVAWQQAAHFPAGNYVARLTTTGKSAQTLKFIKL